MSLTPINDNSDILWISTSIPAIASIYYHLHLRNSHTLYCPDDITLRSNADAPVKQHVRELARNILQVIDSNNYKKLALHFMESVSATRRDDLVRFLLKRRSRLKMSHLILPCPLIQHYYLSGWSYSIADEIDSSLTRQCKVYPTHEPDSPSPYIPSRNVYTDMEFKQPFIISSHEFTKKALFVYITSDMITLPVNTSGEKVNNEMGLFEFKDAAFLAIQGWIDAVITSLSDNGNTLIFIVDEASFYIGSKLQRSSQEERKEILAHGRRMLREKMRSLAREIPIYLYLNFVNSKSTQTALPGIIAWLQQRHQLCVTRSILLTWKHYCFDPKEKPGLDCPASSILTQIEQVELTSMAKYDRPKWKTEFTHLLQKIDSTAHTDQQYISPGKLSNDPLSLETSSQRTAPLLGDGQQTVDQLGHESSEFFDHSVSSSNEQVAQTWILAVLKQKQQQQQHQQHSAIETGGNASEENDTKSDKSDTDNASGIIASTTEEGRAEELENLADSLDHDKIRIFIANTGAYRRGEDLLHTLSHTTYSWNDENNLLMVFAEAKGTSDNPYQVYLALNQKDDINVIRNGYCTCPVGRTGKCKHCVAVLLRFMINVDDFRQSQEQLVMPIASQGSTTKQSLQPSTVNEAISHSENIPTKAASPINGASSSLSSSLPSSRSHSQQSLPQSHLQLSSQAPQQLPPEGHSQQPSLSPAQTNTETKAPSQRRVLPWNMSKPATERGKKRQRPTKITEGLHDATLNESSSIQQTSASLVENVQNAAAKKPRRIITKSKPKAKESADNDSDMDVIGDSSFERIEQKSGKGPFSRRSTRTKQQPTTSIIDDATMWEDDLSDATFMKHQSTPNSVSDAPASTTELASSIDTDDLVLPTTSQHSPLRTMQQSNLSLPMTSLDLFTSKTDLTDDSDTQDEDELPLSLPHADKAQQSSTSKDNNEQQNSGENDTQQQQFMRNGHSMFQRSATSDLFDELDL